MQKLVRFVSQRLMQEVFVQELDFRVLMGLAQGQALVLDVDTLDAFYPLGYS